MNFDRKKFFEGWRVHFGRLNEGQVNTLTLLLDWWEGNGSDDARWLAYALATAHGEVGAQLQPVREGFKDSEAEARKHVAWLKKTGRIKVNYALPDKVTGKSYYGRGLVQLTHKSNYEAMGAILGVDLVNAPDLALDPAYATKILMVGMMRGTYTGKKLADYFRPLETADWRNARRIINGMDRADKFAELGRTYHQILLASQVDITARPRIEIVEAPETLPRPPAPIPPPPDVEPIDLPQVKPLGAAGPGAWVTAIALALAAFAAWLGFGGD